MRARAGIDYSAPMTALRAPAACCSLALLAAAAAAQIDRLDGRAFATRSEVLARHGMAATSQPLATQIALDVLKAGGSAVDAAIAANAALGLMEPTGCGIGGDLFAIVWDAKTRKLHGLNGSGRSPLGLSLERLQSELRELGSATIPPRGFLPISVPGTVHAWFELHARFGVLPMRDLLAPAVRHADEGFPLTEHIAGLWRRGVANAVADPLPGAFLATFAVDGEAPSKGAVFRNPDLARTLAQIGEQGRDVFYRGEIAERIDAFMTEHGGFLRKGDLQAHASTWVDPVSVDYRGHQVCELPPNGQGIAALQMLNILEGFDLAAMGHGSAAALHVMIEAKKLAFEDRAKFYADPEHAKIPLQGLLSKAYAAEQRKRIDVGRAGRSYDAGNPALHDGDTIYLATADAAGNMVSLIQSNYRGMGSGIVVPGLGFCFQDRGEMFTLEPGHANCYAPGKRPFHTIIPAFVLKDGAPWLAFGVMGGAMQPQGHVQILCNLIDFGMNFQEAGDAARWQHLGSTDYDEPKMTDGGYVEVETGVPWQTVRRLLEMGHDVRIGRGGFGGYQAIHRDAVNGIWVGASESRKDGHAAGY
jgi:gamma-glutamyltranspeptidase/glutathione hydrolase